MAPRSRFLRSLLVVPLAVGLASCAAPGPQPGSKGEARQVAPFSPKQLAKTDIDRVADSHRRAAFASVRLLTEKLYRRNPRQWRESGQPSLDAAVARIFNAHPNWQFPELDGKTGGDALHLAFLPEFQGDRVLAFGVGLTSMLDTAFNHKQEFFILDDLDPQKLYNCARNVEIAAWKLNHDKDGEGQFLLLANEGGAGGNLSFEREFGKLIENMDLLATIVEDKANRSVSHVIQSVATAVFLPVH